jgi:hypothetical protein
MLNSIKKHIPDLANILLILMLVVPFALYYVARTGSGFGINLFLVIMGLVMLTAMKK